MPDEVSLKKSRRERRHVLIPMKFRPRFWSDSDARISVVKTIKRRYELLREHAGGNESCQRDMLCHRAAFLSIILETKEVEAAEGGGLDIGSYIQAVNGLSGLLIRLGLSKHVKNVTDLQTYLEGKDGVGRDGRGNSGRARKERMSRNGVGVVG